MKRVGRRHCHRRRRCGGWWFVGLGKELDEAGEEVRVVLCVRQLLP
jgi:hypothetical protein